MKIEEIKSAAVDGNIDELYELIQGESPSDSEREQLKEIALQHVETNPEVAVAVTLGTDTEFGTKIYQSLLSNNHVTALDAMCYGEIPGFDTPVENVLLLIAENCSPEVWDWVIEKHKDIDYVDEEVIKLIGEAALVAAEKNPSLKEKLKTSSWDWKMTDGREVLGNGVGQVGAIYSNSDSFKRIVEAYQPCLDDCVVAAAESGRIDNIEVLLEWR